MSHNAANRALAYTERLVYNSPYGEAKEPGGCRPWQARCEGPHEKALAGETARGGAHRHRSALGEGERPGGVTWRSLSAGASTGTSSTSRVNASAQARRSETRRRPGRSKRRTAYD